MRAQRPDVLACRDVKLENIFIAEDGRVRLGDFGLTMSMKQELAISPVGTVEYMAPEVLRRAPMASHLSHLSSATTALTSQKSVRGAADCRSITPFPAKCWSSACQSG